MKQLSVEVDGLDGATAVTLRGVLDEHNKLFATSKRIRSPLVVVDLSGVKRINSCGARDLTGWIANLEKEGHTFLFVRCSPAVVSQVVMIERFLGEGKTSSFFVELHCPSCEIEHLEEVEVATAFGNPNEVLRNCDTCGTPLVFDEFEGTFSSIVEHLDQPTEPAHLQVIRQYLEHITPGGVVPSSTAPPPSESVSTTPRSSESSPAPARDEEQKAASAVEEQATADARPASPAKPSPAEKAHPSAASAPSRSGGASNLLYVALGGLLVLVILMGFLLLTR